MTKPTDIVLARWIRSFICMAGGLLLALSLVSLLGTTGSAQDLLLSDPLLGIQLRLAMLITGAMELFVALICLFGHRRGLQTGLIAWLATNFAAYQIGMRWHGSHSQWGCLSSLSATLQIPSNWTGFLMISILGCLLLGAYAVLLWPWFPKCSKVVSASP